MKTDIDFDRISRAIRDIALPEVDVVVGIGRGGIVPACLLAYRLERQMIVFPINYRDDENQPRYESPAVGPAPEVPPQARSVLLVDDVSVSGSTLEAARAALGHLHVTTLVLKGTADIVVFPDITTCVNWPWNVKPNTNGRAVAPGTHRQTSSA